MTTKEDLEELRPYIFHGIHLVVNGENAIGDCPFCQREGKFGVKVKSGLWRCVVCDKGGNSTTFIRDFWKLADEGTKTEMYDDLVKQRKLLDFEVVIQWEVVKSPTTGDWLIPGYNADRKMTQLYRYTIIDGKQTLLPTPTLKQQMFGVGLYDKSKPIVFLCEGPWDGMALWEVLRATKITAEGEYEVSHNYGETLLSESNVISVPGCNSFNVAWAKLFEGKVVYIMYDNDYPRMNETSKKELDPAGFAGMKRVSGLLTGSDTPPTELYYLKWGEKGYTEVLPDRTDIRDVFSNPGIVASLATE